MTSTTVPRRIPATRRLQSRGRVARLVRGRAADPRWVRPALLGLLALTALLYLVDLSRNGWANDFYAAAVTDPCRATASSTRSLVRSSMVKA